MPVDLKLSENHRYIIYELSDPLVMAELMQAYEKEQEIRDSIDHTLHSIVDMSAVKRIPPNWLTAKAGPGLKHPRSGEMLFVGIAFGLKIVIDTIMKMMKYEKMRTFLTREEADAYMQELLARTDSAQR